MYGGSMFAGSDEVSRLTGLAQILHLDLNSPVLIKRSVGDKRSTVDDSKEAHIHSSESLPGPLLLSLNGVDL